MPPSPAMRCSPGRELRAENHKRGRSLESGLLLREKDEDLALFNEVQSREKDNFLLQSHDDFEDTFSTKLRYFSDHKLGIAIPVRGETSDLLNKDGEKNDYDWLLTPPDTPLFASLDDECHQTPPVNLAQRGRPRSQPITISRSSTMEKSHRSSRGSASPNRLSPSPRSGTNTFQSRGRSSSAPQSSPTPSFRNATPSRRPSSPPSKPSTPAPRSSTPTPRRMSTSSSGTVASSGVRGMSPVKTSRGNSASPKIRAWQSNIPGFSSEAPPNLRTSLADRPATYVRGTSPASRNGRDSSTRSGRHSMSPTATRSVSSAYSHDRDRFSSHSKGSVASSGEDDVDSLHSIPVGSSGHSASRRVGASPNNRASAFSKKPTRTVPSSSAPKRSFDLALRQMDHRKGPQNMFRPLLSSVPSSTFYVGKASPAHRAMISRNSSVTTSSNASSDQGTSGAHDTEGSDLNQEDITSGNVKAPDPNVQDEVFVFDKVDGLSEDAGPKVLDGSPRSPHGDFNGGTAVSSPLRSSGNISNHDTVMATAATSEILDAKGDFPDIDGLKDTRSCSKCGSRYRAIESIEGDLELCPGCGSSDLPLTIATPVTGMLVIGYSESVPKKTFDERDPFDPLERLTAVPEAPEVTSMDELRGVKEAQTSYSEPIWDFLSRSLVEEGEHRHANQQVIGQPTVSCSIADGETGGRQMQHSGDYQNLKVEVSEGAGISVLLKRSSSGKGTVVQSRNFTASSIAYDDPSYARDSTISMRSSVGHSSTSASSSVDLGSARQAEARFQRQLSGRKSDLENYRCDTNLKHQRTGSSLSGSSSHVFQPLGLSTNTHEEQFDIPVAHVQKDVLHVRSVVTHEDLLASENSEVDTDFESNYESRTMDTATSEFSSHLPHMYLGDSTMTSSSNFGESASCENGGVSTNNARHIWDVEASITTQESSMVEENAVPNSCGEWVNVAEDPTQSSLDVISEIEIENVNQSSPDSQSDAVSLISESSVEKLQEPVPTTSNKDNSASIAESGTSDHARGILEESTVMVGAQGERQARSLTLEEATDTILFCSSIIHNLAYDAASIAMEKENPVLLEGSWPTVTILGKGSSDRKDSRGRTVGKRASKSQKARQRRVETDTKPPSNTKSDEKAEVSATRIVGFPKHDDSTKPPKLESKCNCTIM
ncbi:hypothetical protein RJ639_029145 [Escallonia herrerae]|uniref:Microtubule-associated protein futsch n=1 Tax=Escallonia herrerae TaxID=1293975 RepID=A0AA89BQX9_9ASTE|nr:hypothetical protein RJ639_029145 [Escallonia herrerae]